MTASQRPDLRYLDEKSVASSEQSQGSDSGTSEDGLLMAAKREIGRRKSMERLKIAERIGESGWAVLLDLFVMEARGKRVSAASACIASGSPSKAAQRCLSALVEQGLVARETDRLDGFRAYLRLTGAGKGLVEMAIRNAIDSEEIIQGIANPRSLGVALSIASIDRKLKVAPQTIEKHWANLMGR